MYTVSNLRLATILQNEVGKKFILLQQGMMGVACGLQKGSVTQE
jgi:hypothetical protein